ncbi:MAG: ROK family transcriptional regulator [Chloroflexi bacterium]|nr:MAG: ROK family transcriptional regulator [Chloroflexota bacterium]
MKKATQQHTKEHNRFLVLKTIIDHETISRAQIARQTSLTRTTVSEIVSALLEEGLVREIGIGESKGGKSPIILSLAEDSRYLIGLDLSHSEFRGALVNLHGTICADVLIPVEERLGEEALSLVYKILDQLLASGMGPIVGIGVGTPGLVNSSEGVVINAVNLDWKDLPLGELLQTRYGLPVYVLNDSHAAAMGEYSYGKEVKSDENLVVINARHGIGAGIVIDGGLFLGDGGGAGEIGHVVVVREGGLPCRCGNYGCLETVASAQALVKQVKMLVEHAGVISIPGEINLSGIQKAFEAGDPQIRHMVLETGRYLGIAIASLVGLLNIQRIVISGDMTSFGEPWLQTVEETFHRHTLSRLANSTRITLGQLGRDSVVLGASAVLANNYSLLFLGQS